MRNRLKYRILAAFLIISIGLCGQEKKSSLLSYSVSYIYPTIISHKGEFEYKPIYINFEANFNYKPFDRISFSSGFGYSTSSEIMRFINWEALYEPGNYLKLTDSNFHIPIQINYHITKDPDKDDWYLKAIYKNVISAFKVSDFDHDELVRKDKSYSYEPWVGIGIGSIFLKNKPISIIVEGTIEKYLWEYFFKYETWYSLKIGVLL